MKLDKFMSPHIRLVRSVEFMSLGYVSFAGLILCGVEIFFQHYIENFVIQRP